jgi:hypothetical protein
MLHRKARQRPRVRPQCLVRDRGPLWGGAGMKRGLWESSGRGSRAYSLSHKGMGPRLFLEKFRSERTARLESEKPPLIKLSMYGHTHRSYHFFTRNRAEIESPATHGARLFVRPQPVTLVNCLRSPRSPDPLSSPFSSVLSSSRSPISQVCLRV